MPSLLAAADVYVSPSETESFGCAILEAMAMGIPCVAAETGGVPELATEWTARLFPPGDEEAMFAACVWLWRSLDAREALGKRARLRAVKHFSKEKMVDRYWEALKGYGKNIPYNYRP